ncbi:MAG: ABC transporter permease [Mycoplasmatales bacterium]
MKYLKLLYGYRKEILFLAYQQIKTRYLETAFGIGWAIVTPMVFMFSFWFFFTVGLRGGAPQAGNPYLLNIFASYMPWFVISELITSGTGVIKANGVLVKTIKFPVMALPMINVLSKMFVHIIVMLIVCIIYVFLGGWTYLPDIYYINFIYYWFTMLVFFTGLTFFLSSLATIIRDVKPLVGAIMMPLFWMTPVLYTPQSLRFDIIMRLVDPLYYFIIGYKETLLYEKFFYEEIWYDIYIWVIIALIYIVGMLFWQKVRPLMADLI